MLSISVRIISDVVAIDLVGRFTFTEFKLHDKAKELVNAGCRGLVFNMAEVSYIDSFAVGQMFSIWSSMRAKEGQIVLLRPTEAVQKVFQATKLDAVFKTFTDEAEAVAYLKQKPR
jgi:anti-sigma B factor antagonist